MCVIESRTYVSSDGTRSTFEYPRLCSHASGKNTCRGTLREYTEVRDASPSQRPPLLQDDAPSLASLNPPTPPTGTVSYQERRPIERRPSTKEGDRRRSTRYVKPEIILDFSSSRKKIGKAYHHAAPPPPPPDRVTESELLRQEKDRSLAASLAVEEDRRLAEKLATEEAHQEKIERGRFDERPKLRAWGRIAKAEKARAEVREEARRQKARERNEVDARERERAKREMGRDMERAEQVKERERAEKKERAEKEARAERKERNRLADEVERRITKTSDCTETSDCDCDLPGSSNKPKDTKSAKFSRKISAREREILLLETQAIMERERAVADAREREEHAAELRGFRQTSEYWDPRVSPLRQGSPYAASNNSFNSPHMRVSTAAHAREAQKAESDAFALKHHLPQAEDTRPKTISPKDALPDYHEPDEESKVPLFPDDGASKYEHQYTGGNRFGILNTYEPTGGHSWRDNFPARQQLPPPSPPSHTSSVHLPSLASGGRTKAGATNEAKKHAEEDLAGTGPMKVAQSGGYEPDSERDRDRRTVGTSLQGNEPTQSADGDADEADLTTDEPTASTQTPAFMTELDIGANRAYSPSGSVTAAKVGPASVVESLAFGDNSSVASLADTTFSRQGVSLSSQSSVEELMTAADELAALLGADEELRSLYPMALTNASIGAERFARNFHRLLKMYAKDLRVEAKEPLHRMAAHLTYYRARYVVNTIRKQYDPEYKDWTEKVTSAISQRAREKRLDQYLSRLELGDRQQAAPTGQNDDSDASVSDDDAWDHDTEPLHTLQQVRVYMISGDALKNLRCRFRQFIDGHSGQAPESKQMREDTVHSSSPNQGDEATASDSVKPNGSDLIYIFERESPWEESRNFIELPNNNATVCPTAPSSSTTPNTLNTTSKHLRAEELANSATVLQSPECTLKDDRNVQSNNRNEIRKTLANSIFSLPQAVVTFLGRQIDLLYRAPVNPLENGFFVFLKIEAFSNMFKHWMRQMENTLEALGVREKRIASGLQRLQWTCSCGKSLFDDFVELQPGALEDLRGKLRSESISRECNSGNNALSPGGFFRFGGFLSYIGRISWNRQRNCKSSSSPGLLPTVSSNNSSALPSNLLYLLLCINNGNFGAELYHERIQHIKSDQALFHFLRDNYFQRRSKLFSAISLRTVSSINLVKFAADMSAKVDIYPHSIYCEKSCACVPPESKVEPAPNSEYSCKPIPALHIPPIGENYMMHLYSSPSCINPSQVWIYNQIPKRTRGRLVARPETPVEGWGVHFREGWHWPKIWAVILTFFLGGSLLFGVLYTVLHRDAQSAFGIASYWITAATILFGYLTTRNA